MKSKKRVGGEKKSDAQFDAANWPPPDRIEARTDKLEPLVYASASTPFSWKLSRQPPYDGSLLRLRTHAALVQFEIRNFIAPRYLHYGSARCLISASFSREIKSPRNSGLSINPRGKKFAKLALLSLSCLLRTRRTLSARFTYRGYHIGILNTLAF